MYREFQRSESRNTMNLTQAPQYTPDEAAATSLLQYLTRDELQQYLDDNSKLDAIISDLPQVNRWMSRAVFGKRDFKPCPTSPGFYTSAVQIFENTVGKGEIARNEQFLRFT